MILNETVVSEGTLKGCDLVPKFLDFMAAHKVPIPFGIRSGAAGNPDHSWWSSDDCAEYITDLFECMNDAAPEGFYFGAHEGDGACFGFWRHGEG